MKAPLTKNYYDSTHTKRGTSRKRIYTNSGLGDGKLTTKLLALREFTAQKQPIFKIEKISKYERNFKCSGNARDMLELKAEYLDFLLDNARIF